MKFLTLSKFLMAISLPFLVFLVALNFAAFDSSFYKREFSRYGIDKNVRNAAYLHEKVMEFLQGKSSELPSEFNEREKQHLIDVRNLLRASAISLYILIALFALLLAISSFALKIDYAADFIGKVLFLGGLLTMVLAAALFFLISLDFPSAFESLHQAFFAKGTYLFNPANEMIVRLYPEQLFMDLGLEISKYTVSWAAVLALVGMLLMLKSKSKKNKYKCRVR